MKNFNFDAINNHYYFIEILTIKKYLNNKKIRIELFFDLEFNILKILIQQKETTLEIAQEHGFCSIEYIKNCINYIKKKEKQLHTFQELQTFEIYEVNSEFEIYKLKKHVCKQENDKAYICDNGTKLPKNKTYRKFFKKKEEAITYYTQKIEENIRFFQDKITKQQTELNINLKNF